VSRVGTSRRALTTLAILVGLVVVVAAIGSSGSEALERTTLHGLVLLVATIGFSIFVGNSGVLSFGHVAFMSLGAYATALLALDPIVKQSVLPELPGALSDLHASPYAACVIGGLVAAAVALVLSVPLMRLSGIAAALTSLAVLQIVYVVEREARTLTNGSRGIDGVPTAATVWGAVAFAAVAIVLALAFQQSRWGARLRASREDEVAAHASGIGVHLERRLAWVLSAFVVGAAGGLFVLALGSITPDILYIETTFMLVVMLTVGGQLSVSGAVVGAIFVTVVSELLRRVEAGANIGPVFLDGPVGLSQVGLALILLVTLILRPAGITGGRELALGWPRRRPRASAPASSVDGPPPEPASVPARGRT
jgi:branched-chain amino acid transport system permease protein